MTIGTRLMKALPIQAVGLVYQAANATPVVSRQQWKQRVLVVCFRVRSLLLEVVDLDRRLRQCHPIPQLRSLTMGLLSSLRPG